MIQFVAQMAIPTKISVSSSLLQPVTPVSKWPVKELVVNNINAI
jgi:hypothetical protein